MHLGSGQFLTIKSSKTGEESSLDITLFNLFPLALAHYQFHGCTLGRYDWCGTSKIGSQ